jgi:hypothetical protein
VQQRQPQCQGRGGIALPEGVRLYHLVGGIQAWKRAGLPVESGDPETGGGRVSGLGSW